MIYLISWEYISFRYNVPQKVTRSFAAYSDYFPGTPKRGHEIWI